MKVLVATNQTQGWRDNDFCWTVEGELVVFPPIECDDGGIDDGCGCHRAMAGLASHRATTTIKVENRATLDRDSYFELVVDGLQQQGYVTKGQMLDIEVHRWLQDFVDDHVESAAFFQSDTVLERRGDFLLIRHDPSRMSAVE